MIYKNALNYNMKKQVRGEKQGIISKHILTTMLPAYLCQG